MLHWVNTSHDLRCKVKTTERGATRVTDGQEHDNMDIVLICIIYISYYSGPQIVRHYF